MIHFNESAHDYLIKNLPKGTTLYEEELFCTRDSEGNMTDQLSAYIVPWNYKELESYWSYCFYFSSIKDLEIQLRAFIIHYKGKITNQSH